MEILRFAKKLVEPFWRRNLLNQLKSVEIFSITKNKLPKWVVQWTLIETVGEGPQKVRWNCIGSIKCTTRFLHESWNMTQNGGILMSSRRFEGDLKWTSMSVRWVLTFFDPLRSHWIIMGSTDLWNDPKHRWNSFWCRKLRCKLQEILRVHQSKWNSGFEVLQWL